MEMYFGVAAGAAGQNRSSQVRTEGLQQTHHLQSESTQLLQLFRVLVGLVQRLISAQGILDLEISWQIARIGSASLAGSFALCQP